MQTTENQTFPILYSFRRCPYAMRARLALYNSGIKLELREIILRDKPSHMIEISPKATVPVLQLTNGCVIDESLEIMHYALAQNDPDNWLEFNDHELIRANDNDFKNALDRYKYTGRYPDEDCSGARDQCEDFFITLNNRLESYKFLCANKISLPDIAVFPFIRQCANVDPDWFDTLPYPALQRWLKDRVESDIFSAIMTKHTPWKEEMPALIWP